MTFYFLFYIFNDYVTVMIIFFLLIRATLQGENVELIGDFSNWKEPIKATHKGGPRYEAEVRLAQGK